MTDTVVLTTGPDESDTWINPDLQLLAFGEVIAVFMLAYALVLVMRRTRPHPAATR